MEKVKSFFKEIGIYIAVILITIVVNKFFILVSTVMSSSMEPTIMTGDTAFCNRLAYTKEMPERGDMIIFLFDETGEYLFKRVIGLPGDKITFENDKVLINGEVLQEDYLHELIITRCDKSFEVPAGCVFVMGDNRTNSYDSRYWKDPYVKTEKIMGRCFGNIHFSFEFNIKRPIQEFLSR